MLKHYLVVAFRTLRRERGTTAINVVGLGLGIATAFLLSLYVRHELTYDRFNERADRIHRVWLEEHEDGADFVNVSTPLPLADRLDTDFPEVEHAVRLYAFTDRVRRGPAQFAERIHLAGPAFFDVFSFPLLDGDPATALADPHNVVLSEPIAQKYFGDDDPLGQTLEIRVGGEPQTFTVTGVAAAPPANSSVQFGVLVPFERSLGIFRDGAWDAWQQVYPETYVLLREGTSAAALEAKLPTLIQRVRPDLFEDGPEAYAFHLQPLADIHLDPALPPGLEPTSDPAYPAILAGLALLILLIAGVNFVTLSVSRSMQRAKEVGVRKAVGAQRGQLMRQFWGEALVVTLAALVVGVALAVVALPFFNGLAGTSLRFRLDAGTVGLAVALVGLIALVAGSYPAVVLARIRPVEALRDRLQIRGDRSVLRRALVVTQFALAIFLVASTLLMTRQLDYLRSKPLGFEKAQVVLLPTTGGFRDGLAVYERLREALLREPGFVDVTAAAFGFDEPWAEVGYDADDGSYREFFANFAGYDFTETMGMEMAAGRTFSRAIPADTARGIVVNEALARAYGWTPAEAVGKRLPGASFPDHEILGVVKDFHFASLHVPIGPVVLTPKPDLVLRGASNVNFEGETAIDLAVRLAPGNVSAALGRLEAVWKQVAPEQPFAFSFLDGALDAQYRQEARLGQIVRVAAGLAVLIACLGLFGLAALAAARRTKEIGVRKVLGASVSDLVVLLARDFAGLVLVGFVVAAPVAWFAMAHWLEGFAYRIALGPVTFLVAGVLTLGVALVTVSVHALRAATSDPVKALRYE